MAVVVRLINTSDSQEIAPLPTADLPRNNPCTRFWHWIKSCLYRHSPAVEKVQRSAALLEVAFESELVEKSALLPELVTVIREYVGDPIYARLEEIGPQLVANPDYKPEFHELVQLHENFNMRRLRYLDIGMLDALQEIEREPKRQNLIKLIQLLFRDFHLGVVNGENVPRVPFRACFSHYFATSYERDDQEIPRPIPLDFSLIWKKCWRADLFQAPSNWCYEPVAGKENDSVRALEASRRVQFIQREVDSFTACAMGATLEQLQQDEESERSLRSLGSEMGLFPDGVDSAPDSKNNQHKADVNEVGLNGLAGPDNGA